MPDIFAAAKAAAAAPQKSTKTSDVPVLDDEEAKKAAQQYTRASYLIDILTAVKDDASQTIKDRATHAMINHGAKTLSRPTSLRVLTELGQVSATLTARGVNRPLDDDTIEQFKKYGISTTKRVTSPAAYVFNSDVLKVPAAMRRISDILSQDPEIQQLLSDSGITAPVIAFQPEQSGSVIADASFSDLFKSAVAGTIANSPDLNGDQKTDLVKQLFDVLAVIKTESSVKPKNLDMVATGNELLSMILDDGTEDVEGTSL